MRKAKTQLPRLKPRTAREIAFIRHLDEYEKCAAEVGHLCFSWTSLEFGLDCLLAVMIEKRNGVDADAILGNIEVRDKIRIAAAIGFQKRLSDDWFAVLKWCLDQIDNDLRNRRNRFVHDRWHVTFDGIKRIQKKTGFRKAQAFQALEFYTKVEEKTDREAVLTLIDDIVNMNNRMAILITAFLAKTARWKKSLAELGLLPPQQAR